MYEERFYRTFSKTEFSLEISYKESDLFIKTSKKLDKKIIYDILKRYYSEIENYIKKNPLFLTSLSPLTIDENASPIIKEMLFVSQETKIGPFASVAGAIAQYLGKELLIYTDEIIIENGGDIFLKINEEKKLGIYLGDKILNDFPTDTLILKIKQKSQPFGIASSSAYIGESLNFGRVQLLTVIASTAIIADGFATALSNLIKREKDIKNVIEIVKKNPSIYGLVIAFEGKVFFWGEIEISNV